MAATRSVRITEAPQTNLDGLFKKRGGANAVTPEAQLYGIYGPQYAALLSRDKKSSSEAAFDRGHLAHMASEEQDRYDAAIAAANAAQQQIAETEGNTSTREAIINRMPDYVDRGIGSALDTTGAKYGVFADPVSQAVVQRGDNAVLNGKEADRVNTLATGYGVLADKLGVRPPVAQIEKDFTNPNSDPALGPIPMEEYHPYSQETQRYGTDQGLTFDQQLQLANARAEAAKARGQQLEVSVTQQPGGAPTVTYKGDPQTLIDNGIDPTTGKPLNPKAGVHGGGTSATPAAKPLTSVATDPHSFFNASHVTSKQGERIDPINGKHKYHDGVDYAYPKGTPIPAEQKGVVTFVGDIHGYGNSVKVRYVDGSIIQYSHNSANTVRVGQEVNRGDIIGKVGSTGRSTGPHVHRRVEVAGNSAAVYAQRALSNPSVATAQPLPDGRVLVAMKDGSKRVYKDGKRIG